MRWMVTSSPVSSENRSVIAGTYCCSSGTALALVRSRARTASSGNGAGPLPSSSARVRCTEATASPSRYDSPWKSPPTSSARISASANRSRAEAVAMAQPSAEFAAYSVTMPSEQGPAPSAAWNEPSSRATCGLPARPSTRLSSMSGLMPQVTRRNSLRIASSSKITLVLLCSASKTRGHASSGRTVSGSFSKVRSATVADRSTRPSR